ncbi:alpha/beta fold hydrolase [Neptuniibacter caesariensis]|uniref:Putative biotin biosynthesis protein n=1 Tax=Neptuniibacter caesariensis TaxID=207954 RepID=A0A7U8GQZ9_NEPCE|nr:alpha/beta fold hydrolase [Neptuniibacter caesariensis]EAR60837.1 putative biotin biosynthesis protein [Oceanospirillum sp. MED92] [Neptuniibacter caesariensis]
MGLHVERVGGEGKPELVMLHGWGMNSSIWSGVVENLASNYSITLIDLPGLGRSVSYPEPYTSDGVIQMLADAAPEKASWIGWSMGGQLAIQFADRYPERVERLVTIASNPCFVQKPDWRSAMDEETHNAFEISLSENVAKTLSRFAMLQTQGAEAARDTLKQLKAALKVAEPSAPVESLGLLREDVRSQLSALKMPLLQMFGEKDLLVPVSAALECDALTSRASIVYPGAGHLPFISHQAELVSDLTRFLQEPLA